MKPKYKRVYQFKVALKGVEPPIWRRIQVPETYTFWDLHVAIQDSMGWRDSHLHEFRIRNPLTGLMEAVGIPGEEFEGDAEVHAGWERQISDYFRGAGDTAEYVYDLGDNWQHMLEFEEILPPESGVEYPLCIGGERACPPEDCGGVEGFHEFLEAALVLGHERRRETLAWPGGEFDVRKFDPEEVVFDDPWERWEVAFQDDEER